MVPLLRPCFQSHEKNAWTDLFRLVEEAATPPVRGILSRTGVSRIETEEVVLELFEQLYRDDCRKLRSCRASTEAEFRAWLVIVAKNFARNWVDRHRRRVARDNAALSALSAARMTDRSGLDERQLQARLAEWKPLMRPGDFNRLLVLIGEASAQAVSGRTRRRWANDLVGNYPHLFGD